MDYEIRKEDGIVIVSIAGNLFGEQQTKEISDQLSNSVNEGQNLVIVDLKEMKFINSLGLNFLLSVLTKARKSGGEAYLTNISDQLSKLLVITKLNAVFNVAPDLETAKQKITNSTQA